MILGKLAYHTSQNLIFVGDDNSNILVLFLQVLDSIQG